MTRRAYIYIGAMALVLAALGGYWLYRSHVAAREDAPAAGFVVAASTSTPGGLASRITADTPAAPGMKRYFNQSHHFTLEYPQNLQVSEFPGDGDSLVVAFKDPSTGEGFQVFATPYDEPQITQQRFQEDEPSGVMDSPQNITIDGAAATEFYSQDQAMGDTREIWFLQAGILYEVTTYKSLDSWLLQIMQTWNFV